MNERGSIQAQLARGFDPAELRRIKRLWVRHSIAEDRRDIDGLISTLASDCVYEIVGTGLRWEGHPGARAFYDQRRAAGDTHHRALRALANRLVGILHGCLRHGALYDETTAWAHRSQAAA